MIELIAPHNNAIRPKSRFICERVYLSVKNYFHHGYWTRPEYFFPWITWQQSLDFVGFWAKPIPWCPITTACQSKAHDTAGQGLREHCFGKFIEEKFGSTDISQTSRFKHVKCSTQQDGSSCGVHVILNTRQSVDVTEVKPSTKARFWQLEAGFYDCLPIPMVTRIPGRWRQHLSISQDELRYHEWRPRACNRKRLALQETLDGPEPNGPHVLEGCATNGHTDMSLKDIERTCRAIQRRGIIKRIPKGSRKAAAEALSKVLTTVVSTNTPESWLRLFRYPMECLTRPNRKCPKSHNTRKRAD